MMDSKSVSVITAAPPRKITWKEYQNRQLGGGGGGGGGETGSSSSTTLSPAPEIEVIAPAPPPPPPRTIITSSNPFSFFHLIKVDYSLDDLQALSTAQLVAAWVVPHADYDEEKHEKVIKRIVRARREKRRHEIGKIGLGVNAQVDPSGEEKGLHWGFEMLDLSWKIPKVDELDSLSSAQLAALPFHPDYTSDLAWTAETIFAGRREQDLARGLVIVPPSNRSNSPLPLPPPPPSSSSSFQSLPIELSLEPTLSPPPDPSLPNRPNSPPPTLRPLPPVEAQPSLEAKLSPPPTDVIIKREQSLAASSISSLSPSRSPSPISFDQASTSSVQLSNPHPHSPSPSPTFGLDSPTPLQTSTSTQPPFKFRLMPTSSYIHLPPIPNRPSTITTKSTPRFARQSELVWVESFLQTVSNVYHSSKSRSTLLQPDQDRDRKPIISNSDSDSDDDSDDGLPLAKRFKRDLSREALVYRGSSLGLPNHLEMEVEEDQKPQLEKDLEEAIVEDVATRFVEPVELEDQPMEPFVAGEVSAELVALTQSLPDSLVAVKDEPVDLHPSPILTAPDDPPLSIGRSWDTAPLLKDVASLRDALASASKLPSIAGTLACDQQLAPSNSDSQMDDTTLSIVEVAPSEPPKTILDVETPDIVADDVGVSFDAESQIDAESQKDSVVTRPEPSSLLDILESQELVDKLESEERLDEQPEEVSPPSPVLVIKGSAKMDVDEVSTSPVVVLPPLETSFGSPPLSSRLPAAAFFSPSVSPASSPQLLPMDVDDVAEDFLETLGLGFDFGINFASTAPSLPPLAPYRSPSPDVQHSRLAETELVRESTAPVDLVSLVLAEEEQVDEDLRPTREESSAADLPKRSIKWEESPSPPPSWPVAESAPQTSTIEILPPLRPFEGYAPAAPTPPLSDESNIARVPAPLPSKPAPAPLPQKPAPVVSSWPSRDRRPLPDQSTIRTSPPPAPAPPPPSSLGPPIDPQSLSREFQDSFVPLRLEKQLISLRLENLPRGVTRSEIVRYLPTSVIGVSVPETERRATVRDSPVSAWIAFPDGVVLKMVLKSHIAKKTFPDGINQMWYDQKQGRKDPWRWGEMSMDFIRAHRNDWPDLSADSTRSRRDLSPPPRRGPSPPTRRGPSPPPPRRGPSPARRGQSPPPPRRDRSPPPRFRQPQSPPPVSGRRPRSPSPYRQRQHQPPLPPQQYDNRHYDSRPPPDNRHHEERRRASLPIEASPVLPLPPPSQDQLAALLASLQAVPVAPSPPPPESAAPGRKRKVEW